MGTNTAANMASRTSRLGHSSIVSSSGREFILVDKSVYKAVRKAAANPVMTNQPTIRFTR